LRWRRRSRRAFVWRGSRRGRCTLRRRALRLGGRGLRRVRCRARGGRARGVRLVSTLLRGRRCGLLRRSSGSWSIV